VIAQRAGHRAQPADDLQKPVGEADRVDHCGGSKRLHEQIPRRGPSLKRQSNALSLQL